MLQFVNTCSRKYANLGSSSRPVGHPAQKAALLSCLHTSASLDSLSPLDGEVLGDLPWCQGKAGLAKGPGSERICASVWKRLHPGLAGAGTMHRDMGLGQDGHLSMSLCRLSPAWKGGRESRRGSLVLFCTCSVLKPGQRSLWGDMVSCCDAWRKM